MSAKQGLIDQLEDGKKACKQTYLQTIIDILLTNCLLICLFTCFLLSYYWSTKQALIDQS